MYGGAEKPGIRSCLAEQLPNSKSPVKNLGSDRPAYQGVDTAARVVGKPATLEHKEVGQCLQLHGTLMKGFATARQVYIIAKHDLSPLCRLTKLGPGASGDMSAPVLHDRAADNAAGNSQHTATQMLT